MNYATWLGLAHLSNLISSPLIFSAHPIPCCFAYFIPAGFSLPFFFQNQVTDLTISL